MALLLSTLNLFYRDIQYLFNLVITLWFYLTPVVYAVEFFPEQYRWIFRFNPMSVFINAYRQVIFNGTWPNISSMGIGILVALVIFIISHQIYKRLESTFADVV